MPELTIPLVGNPATRLGGTYASTKDPRYINCVFTEAITSATGKKAIFVEKRNGLSANQTPSSGDFGDKVFYSPSTGLVISVFSPSGGGSRKIYDGTTLLENISGLTGVLHISEVVFNSHTYIFFLTTNSSTQSGYFYRCPPNQAATSITGDTHTNTTIDNINLPTGLEVGMPISGTGIQAGTRIASILSANSITTTLATTATNAGVTITVGLLAKVIDADFPTDCVGPFVEIDGYLCIGTRSGRVYNFDLNSVSSIGSANYIPANISTDLGVGAFKYKNLIGFFGNNSTEFFENKGNPSNSPLSSRKDLTISGIGCLGSNGSEAEFVAKQDQIYWVAQDGALYTLENGAKKLTQPGTVITDNGTGIISSFLYRGLTVISVFISSAGGVKWYFPEYDLWSETSFTGAHFSSDNYTSGRAQTYAVTIDNTSGKTFTLAGVGTNVFQDNGSAFTMTIQTEPIYLNGGKGFIINSIELIADTQASGSTTLKTSADDYANFNTIDTFDLTAQRKEIAPGGYYESHVIFQLTDSGNQPWRGQALKVDWTPC